MIESPKFLRAFAHLLYRCHCGVNVHPVFLTWDPQAKAETFTVQPKFEGNAQDFGMVIPTPTQPKLHEMPRDFFKHLAVYSILKKREFPNSKLLPILPMAANAAGSGGGAGRYAETLTAGVWTKKPTVVV